MCTCCPCIDRAGRLRNKGKLYSPHCVVTTHNLVLPRHRGQQREWCTVLDPSFHRLRLEHARHTDTVTAHNLHDENHSTYIIQAWLGNRERFHPTEDIWSKTGHAGTGVTSGKGTLLSFKKDQQGRR